MKTRRAAVLVFTWVLLMGAIPTAGQTNNFEGRWTLTVEIPAAPGSRNTQTLGLNVQVLPRSGSLIGRMLITDGDNQTVGGTWRQVGKSVSFTYELPCPRAGGAPCATLVVLGKVKFGTRFKKAKVIVMWDSPSDRDPALFDTSLGTAVGDRVL